ncbi:MAG TPA: undecaprenyl/decaprenyl-phosphate alpha-N-acetylglucosaminyl 1-phosphate transferase [Firmicutes bacterium]|nr:undecaprenyl/decaprenyl-phosphate alpha-N-acetylglucosaminyl 1-phosphate transferase [Bacillota bacterium]
MQWSVFGWNLALLTGIGFVFAFPLTAFWTKKGNAWGLLDLPRERRVHETPRPYTGGLAIFIAFSLGLLLTGGLTFPHVGPLLFGGLAIFLLGFFDDKYDLPAGWKLLVQLLVAAFITCADVRIAYLTNPFGDMVALGWKGYPLTIIWLVLTINIINLIDGLDGLAAGVSAIAGVSLLIIGMGLGQSAAVFLCALLIGVLLGFLPYNFYPARVFMGNSGAYFLGYLLGVISVMGALKIPTVLALAIPVFAMGIPFLDTIWAVWRRWRGGNRIMRRDLYHIHYLLLTSGLGPRKTVLLLYGLSLLSGLASVFLSRVTLLIGLFILLTGMGLLFFCLRGLLNMQSAAREREAATKAGKVKDLRGRGNPGEIQTGTRR